MRAILFSTLFFTLCLKPASATFTCFFNFGTLATDEEQSLQLAADTYLRLLSELGPDLSVETLTAQSQAANPFDLADQAGKDRGELQKNLKRFEKMLTEKGWRTPALIARLRTDLAQYARGRTVAQRKVEQGVERSWPNYDIPLPQGKVRHITPDGRYLINVVTSPTDGPTVDVFDLQTKSWTNNPTPSRDVHEPPEMSPDGRELVFRSKEGWDIVPLSGGKLDWPNRRTSRPAGEIRPGRLMYVGLESARASVLNLDDGQVRPLKMFGRFQSGERNRGVGIIPGTDQIYLLRGREADKVTYLEKLKVLPTGEVSLEETRGPWKSDDPARPAPRDLVWSPDGHHLLSFWGRTEQVVSSFEAGDTAPSYHYTAQTHGTEYGKVGDIGVNPKTGEAAILFHGEGAAAMKNWAEIVDMKTKRVKGRVELPWHTSKVLFNPQGDTLFAIQEKNVKVINYGRYLPE